MRIKHLFATTVAATLLLGCVGTEENEAKSEASTASQAEEAIAAAETAASKADSVGFEWRDTGEMIKSAKEALAAKKFEEATLVANMARKQGELAYQQYLSQKD